MATQSHTGSHRPHGATQATQGHAKLHRATQGHAKLHGATQHHTGPYRVTQGHTGPHGPRRATHQSYKGPHGATQGDTELHEATQHHMGSHRSHRDTQGHTELHRVTQGHTELHGATQHHTEPHSVTQSHTGPHRATQRHTELHGPHKPMWEEPARRHFSRAGQAGLGSTHWISLWFHGVQGTCRSCPLLSNTRPWGGQGRWGTGGKGTPACLVSTWKVMWVVCVPTQISP